MSDGSIANTPAESAAEAITTIANGGQSPVESGSDIINQNGSSDVKEAIQDAIDNGASEEEVKDMIEEFELDIFGKRERVKLDLNDKEAIKRELQLARAGRRSMQEVAELKKMYEQEMLALKENPERLSELGVDLESFAEKLLRKKVEDLKKSPEQLEQERIREELKQAREELAQQKQVAEEARIQKIQQEARVQLDEEMTSALQKHPDLPKTKKTVARIADALAWAVRNGFEDASVEDVIPSVKAEIKREMNEFLGELPDEKLIEAYLGKKAAEKLRMKRLNQKKEQIVTADAVKPVVVSKEDKDENPYRSPKTRRSKDFFRNL